MSQPVPLVRGGGRPPDPIIRPRVLEATREIVAARASRASISAIAALSGVGKPTIYLRWSSLREMVIDALHDAAAPLAQPSLSDPMARAAWVIADDEAELARGPRAGFYRSVIFWTPRDGAVDQALEQAILGPRRERLRAALAEAAGVAPSDGPMTGAAVRLSEAGPLVAATGMTSAHIGAEDLVVVLIRGIGRQAGDPSD